MIGNKIADEITSVSKKKSAKELQNDEAEEEDVERVTHKKDAYLQKKGTNYWWIMVSTWKVCIN